VVLSIDDLYLPHADLVSLAAAHPQNVLWRGRGQPGTHDIDLGVKTLSALKAGDHKVELPQFDKSLFAGEGDRLPEGDDRIVVEQPPPLDIVIVEGWCVGFHPISEDELLGRWTGVWKIERKKLGLGEEEMGKLEDVKAINYKLKDYVRLWTFFDVFVQVHGVHKIRDPINDYYS
jgi:D-glycerate 3-kinase